MQVALATLWSCFPVSASGADVLLFSLLHTSSGSCCSPETNHGLLRSSHSPFFFLSLSLSLCFLSPLYLSLLTVFSLVFPPSFCLSYSLCFPLVTPKQPSLSMGIQGAQGKGRGQDLSEAALPGGNQRNRGPLFPPLLLVLSVSKAVIPWKTFTCSTCLTAAVRSIRVAFFSCPCWQRPLRVGCR